MDIITEINDVEIPVVITEEEIVVDISETVIEVNLDGAIAVLPGGAYWIDDLLDVDTVTDPPTNGQVLVWNTTLTQWVPGSIESPSAVVSEEYDYDGVSLALNDFVFISSSRYVSKAIDNKSINPVVGIVTALLSPTKVEVTHSACIDVPGPLVSGKKVFIGVSGGITSSLPGSDYIQCVGVAISSSRMYFNPELSRRIRLTI